MLLSSAAGIFGDELVSAKDLNRQPGRILDVALERPVTITRSNQYFTLLRREKVTSMIQAAGAAKLAFEVSSAAFRLIQGAKLSAEHPYGWLSAFSKDDLEEFVDEISSTLHRFEGTQTVWEEVDAIVHEWRESSIAIGSPDLAEAMQAEPDEVLLECCCNTNPPV